MRNRNRLPFGIAAIGLASAIILVAGTAVAQQLTPSQQLELQKLEQKQNQQNQQKAAAANAKKTSEAEKAAMNKAGAAKKHLASLNEKIKAAQQDLDDAIKARTTLEDEIIDAQPADSDLGKLRDKYRAADKKYQDARKSVLESDDYKAALEAARNSDGPEARLALQKQFDTMPVIADSRTLFQDAKEEYELPKVKLLAADSKWVDADKEVKSKQEALDTLNREFTEANVAANKARADARQAAAAAAAAANYHPKKPRRGY